MGAQALLVCLSLDLRTCQLQAIPALVDGRGALNNEDPPVSVEEARLPEALAGVDGDDLVDHDLEVDGDGLLVHLMAGSNHLARLDSASFDGVPELRSLDASLNHIVAVDWNGPPPKRLRTLVLANNQLKSLESLAPLGRSLRHLDVSLNDLESLAGIEALPKLVALAASGNRLKQLPPLDALGDLKVLDLQHNSLDSADALAPLAALTTLKLSHNRLVAFPPLLDALGGLRLQHLTLYGNALTSAANYPDALLLQQPWLETLDFVQLPPARIAEGGASRASLSDAVGSVVASALSQHAAQRAKMRAKHEALVEALRRQQEAATYALQEYMAVTSKAEKIFQDKVAETRAAREKVGRRRHGRRRAAAAGAAGALVEREGVPHGVRREGERGARRDVRESARAEPDRPHPIAVEEVGPQADGLGSAQAGGAGDKTINLGA